MGVRAISFSGIEGDRISHCFGFGGMDFDEDGAIAPLAFPDIQVSVERLLA
jgi:acyl CoA:acetate/3-ketoacid CoA transferase beta subunit